MTKSRKTRWTRKFGLTTKKSTSEPCAIVHLCVLDNVVNLVLQASYRIFSEQISRSFGWNWTSWSKYSGALWIFRSVSFCAFSSVDPRLSGLTENSSSRYYAINNLIPHHYFTDNCFFSLELPMRVQKKRKLSQYLYTRQWSVVVLKPNFSRFLSYNPEWESGGQFQCFDNASWTINKCRDFRTTNFLSVPRNTVKKGPDDHVNKHAMRLVLTKRLIHLFDGEIVK